MVVFGLILVIIILLIMLYVLTQKLYDEIKTNEKKFIELTENKILYAESHADLNTILGAVDDSKMTSDDEEYDYDAIRKLLIVIESINVNYEVE